MFKQRNISLNRGKEIFQGLVCSSRNWFVLSGQRHTMHNSPNSGVIKRLNAVHCAAVVPHDDIVLGPDVTVNKLVLRRMYDELVKKCSPVVRVHTIDIDHRVRREK